MGDTKRTTGKSPKGGSILKLIEGMKKVQDLSKKADDLKQKIAKYCVDLDFETPTYGTPEQQREQIKEWLQAHHDIIKKIEELRMSIFRTNLLTLVTIENAITELMDW